MSNPRRKSLDKVEADFDPLSMLGGADAGAAAAADDNGGPAGRASTSSASSGFDDESLRKDLGIDTTPPTAGRKRPSQPADSGASAVAAPSSSSSSSTAPPAPAAAAASPTGPPAPKNLTPARAGAATVTAGGALPSPNVGAPSDLDGSVDPVLEDPCEGTASSAETQAAESGAPPAAAGAAADSGAASTERKSAPKENSVTMRISRLDDAIITRIRRESQCKISYSAATTGVQTDKAERSITLTGGAAAVKKAQTMIRRLQQESAENVYVAPPTLDGEDQILETRNASFIGPDGRHRAVPGVLEMTTYRLRFMPTGPQSANLRRLKARGYLEIPLFTIARAKTLVEQGSKEFKLVISCKDMRSLHFSLVTEGQVSAGAIDQRIKFFVFAFSMHSPIDALFTTMRRNELRDQSEKTGQKSLQVNGPAERGWGVYSLTSELRRQRLLPPEAAEDKAAAKLELHPYHSQIRVCTENLTYELCPTYPGLFASPSGIPDATVRDCATFRTKGRLPMFCWVHDNQASLWRCSQPRVGLSGNRNAGDEAMLAGIRKTNPSGKPLCICDCRPKVNAYANRAKGGGFEFSGHYRQTDLSFMEIHNIHVMRGAFEKLEKVCTSQGRYDLTWHTAVADTQWLGHVTNVLYSTLKMCHEIANNQRTVLVHCSDGWDRTAQVCALVQVLLDPFFRTIHGFQVLVCKEWLHAGHRFQTRIGHGDENAGDSDRSPIFLQFLDCTWQLLNQYPLDFEFNEEVSLVARCDCGCLRNRRACCKS